MNYLAAYIEREAVHWVVAEADSALVLEHGTFKLDIPSSIDIAEETPDIEEDQKAPSLSYSSATAFISTELATNLEIDLPFNDPKKVEKVIPLQLQDKLPFELYNVHFVAKEEASKVEDHYRYFISYINKTKFESILDTCSKHGINFEIISIESFYLEPLIRALLKASEDEGQPVNKSVASVAIGYLTNDADKLSTKREAIISLMRNDETLHARKLNLPTQPNFLSPYLESHVRISLSSAQLKAEEVRSSSNFTVFATSNIGPSTEEAFRSLPNLKIEKLEPQYAPDITEINNPKLLFALFSAQSALFLEQEIKEQEKFFPNLRNGPYRYRAPLTEIKEAFLDQIAPIALVFIFGLLTIVFKVLTPLKEDKLVSEQINQIVSQELEHPVKKGNEIQELESAISALEQNLGSLSGVSHLSPIEWLYTLSNVIPKSLDVEFDSVSISSEGISFRGSVVDYPTSGKLDSILKTLKSQHPDKFCEAYLSTEEGSSRAGRKPVVGEINLCK